MLASRFLSLGFYISVLTLEIIILLLDLLVH